MKSSETRILNSIKESRARCEAIDDLAHTSDLALLSSMALSPKDRGSLCDPLCPLHYTAVPPFAFPIPSVPRTEGFPGILSVLYTTLQFLLLSFPSPQSKS